ncbi:hypothetical protein [Kaarinaea lacus]
MEKKIAEIINNDFKEPEKQKAIECLASITLQHVMAGSKKNLINTQLSILKLAKGNLEDLVSYVEAAKKDFRDVIFWASQE